MSNKTYTLILNSVAPENVTTTGGLSAYTYYVNWGSFLPKSVRRFSVKAVFRSNTTNTVLNETALVYVSFGARELYDQSSSSSQLVTIAQPDSYLTSTANAPRFYYNSYDNPSFMATYPSNDFVTVRLTNPTGQLLSTAGGVAASQNPGYILTLSFTEIQE